MSRPEWMDQAAAYALGALDADERAAFEARLAEDRQLREEVAAYRRVVDEIGTLAGSVDPPAELRARVIERARGVRPLGAAGPTVEPPGPTPRGSRVPAWLAWGLAAAGLVASVSLWTARRDLEADRAALRQDYDTALDSLARVDSTLDARDALLDALRAGSLRSAALADAGGATAARVFYDPDAGRFTVLAPNLPDVPAGRAYQLWAIAEGQPPASVGTFDVVQGNAGLTLSASQAVRDLGDLALAALTVEPAGGSPQPTETPRYVGAWVAMNGPAE